MNFCLVIKQNIFNTFDLYNLQRKITHSGIITRMTTKKKEMKCVVKWKKIKLNNCEPFFFTRLATITCKTTTRKIKYENWDGRTNSKLFSRKGATDLK